MGEESTPGVSATEAAMEAAMVMKKKAEMPPLPALPRWRICSALAAHGQRTVSAMVAGE